MWSASAEQPDVFAPRSTALSIVFLFSADCALIASLQPSMIRQIAFMDLFF
jgi:hypothetical protein